MYISNPVDYYQILRIPRKATAKEIRDAYKKLSVELHPDKNPGDMDATAKFQAVNEAYQTLYNSVTRRQYDRSRPFPDDGDILLFYSSTCGIYFQTWLSGIFSDY
eukprot:TRINITY_DN2440_c0_g1_i1.p1 TRINITY_DN2440_c0_g1~~TRINITY_DN2440_c0_g1_i1.p1  ORF type:complete len:105 (+),score=0.38 TRINITY_DN2440_c0_g1_i1:150-464(+)